MSEREALSVAETEKVEATQVEQLATVFVVTGGNLAETVSLISSVKKRHADVDEIRRSFTDPIRTGLDRINAFFRPALKGYENAERILKGKVLEFQQTAEIERQRLLATVATDPAGAAHAIAVAEQHVAQPVAGLAVRTEWVGEVSDAALIPREYLVPDLDKLLAVTKAHKGDPGIPGWKAFSRQVAAVRK